MAAQGGRAAPAALPTARAPARSPGPGRSGCSCTARGWPPACPRCRRSSCSRRAAGARPLPRRSSRRRLAGSRPPPTGRACRSGFLPGAANWRGGSGRAGTGRRSGARALARSARPHLRAPKQPPPTARPALSCRTCPCRSPDGCLQFLRHTGMYFCISLKTNRVCPNWDIPYWFSTKYRNTFRYAVEIANNHLETCMDKFCKKALAGLGVVAALAPAEAAGQTWPTRPFSFVVPFTPGGITDSNSQLLAKILSDKLGQPVVVENRPGAGGSIGVEAAVRQPPDGYTMIYGTSGTQAANLALYKNIRYDPVKDFVPVHALSATPLVLVVHPERPFKTVPALIAYAKAHPGQLNFGSAGAGTGTHLSAELFQATTGIRMTHVPYKGSSPALTDLMAGNLDLMFDYAAVVLPFVQAGKLRP